MSRAQLRLRLRVNSSSVSSLVGGTWGAWMREVSGKGRGGDRSPHFPVYRRRRWLLPAGDAVSPEGAGSTRAFLRNVVVAAPQERIVTSYGTARGGQGSRVRGGF